MMQCKSGGYLDGGKGDRLISEEVVDEAGRGKAVACSGLDLCRL